jgi:arylsulfatase A-like enzyme
MFLGLVLGTCGRSAPRPRNLILISLDTLRPDHLSSYGNPRATSPAIDALAARGVRFSDASSAAPWTLPSHTTMFTGLYPSHHGVKDYSHRLRPEVETLAEILAARGFETQAVINTWNLADPRYEIFQGFQPADVHYIREAKQQGGVEVILNTGREVAAAARAALEARDSSRPFFLLAHFYDAHTDFTPEERFRSEFVPPYGGKLDGTTAQLMAIRGQGLMLREKDLEHLRALYDAEIRGLDEIVGEFLEYLRSAGLAEETLIVLTSDHGEEFQEHGGLLHGRTQYQELLRVPLILAGPGIPPGVVVDQPVGLVDLLPTILACLGAETPAGLDGLDLSPTWRGERLAERVLFGEADHNNVVQGKPVIDVKRMARLGSEKLVFDAVDQHAQLFDLALDPSETQDRSSQAPERARVLREALERFRAGAVEPQRGGEGQTGENLELLRNLGYGGEEER